MSVFSQVDSQGLETALLENICDYSSIRQAFFKDDDFITSQSVKKLAGRLNPQIFTTSYNGTCAAICHIFYM